MFDTDIHYYLILMLEIKASSLQFEWSPIRGSTLVGSSLAGKYYTRVEVEDNGKRHNDIRHNDTQNNDIQHSA